MTKIKTKKPRLFGLILASLSLAVFLLVPTVSRASDNLLTISANNSQQIDDLEESVSLKKSEIDKIQKKIEVYEKSLLAKQQEKITLQNELESISEKISQLELRQKKVNLEIDATNLEIQSVLLQILDKEDQLNQQKEQIAELLRSIYLNDQKNYLEILVTNKTFGDFFDDVTQLKQVESGLKKSLDEIQMLKIDLEKQRGELEIKSQQLADFKNELASDQSKLDNQETAKTYYLTQTKKSEKNFQSLIQQAKTEQQQINNEIVSLEKTIRQKLAGEGKEIVSTGRFLWPVPRNTITAYFHDPDYPFRNIFEHPAIDIRAAQGTAVKAADSGYVAKVKNGGARGYSYIMIIHNDGLATVYGHVSKIYVTADSSVAQGDVIALSGGLPGTSGSGPLSTGAHLHFEVRLNGIPVNALDYLP